MALTRCTNNHLYSIRRYGKICPYCPQPEQDEEIKPVVGWLVCSKGANIGRDFKIVAGKNLIGRDQDMSIRILGDANIINRNHAAILFESKTQITTLMPGETKLIFCNGNMVRQPLELTDFDTIELGKSTFEFISLCGDNFSWAKGKLRDIEPNTASSNSKTSQEEPENDTPTDKTMKDEDKMSKEKGEKNTQDQERKVLGEDL